MHSAGQDGMGWGIERGWLSGSASSSFEGIVAAAQCSVAPVDSTRDVPSTMMNKNTDGTVLVLLMGWEMPIFHPKKPFACHCAAMVGTNGTRSCGWTEVRVGKIFASPFCVFHIHLLTASVFNGGRLDVVLT